MIARTRYYGYLNPRTSISKESYRFQNISLLNINNSRRTKKLKGNLLGTVLIFRWPNNTSRR